MTARPNLLQVKAAHEQVFHQPLQFDVFCNMLLAEHHFSSFLAGRYEAYVQIKGPQRFVSQMHQNEMVQEAPFEDHPLLDTSHDAKHGPNDAAEDAQS